MILLCLLALLALPFALTACHSLRITRRFAAEGRMVEARGRRLHVVERGTGEDGEPPLLFLHGASGNLRDQLAAFADALPPGRRALFVDRPGHGHSQRGPNASTPSGQADAIVGMLDTLGIDRVVAVGHSFGGSVALGLALEHPHRVAGLALVAPAAFPWPGGRTSWYYDLAARPVLGRLFAATLLVPLGLRRMSCAVGGVFSPQAPGPDYMERAGVALAIRPGPFRANALDVTRVYRWFAESAPRYRGIRCPTVIVTGDRDAIVSPRVHSLALSREIRGSRLVVVPGLGHKPDYCARALVLDAIGAVASGDVGAFRPVVRPVPAASDAVPTREIEHGLETGPERPAPLAERG